MNRNPAARPDHYTILREEAGEIAGSVGNFGTVLPLLIAVSSTTGMSLSRMLVICGIWYILIGGIYQIPLSVEPLKAVAALSIAGQSTPEVIAASGILTGVIFLVLGYTNSMEWIHKRIPTPVIRGIQLALGLILLRSAFFDFGMKDPFFFVLCIGIIILFLLIRMKRNFPDISALMIMSIGAGAILSTYGVPTMAIPALPLLVLPDLPDFLAGGVNLVLPQIPLTITNSILATSLLASELYQRRIEPDRLSRTVGLMSISSSLTGGFPLCHGAGGVAAHYRFGAKSGISMIFGGIILISIACLITDPAILTYIPQGIFGALLLAVSGELLKGGMKTNDLKVPGIMAIIAITAGIAVSFVCGLALSVLIQWVKKRNV